MELNAAVGLSPLFEVLLPKNHHLRIEFWDGSTIGEIDAKAIIHIRTRNALRRVLWAPGELGLSRAYVMGEIDFSGDGFLALSELLTADPSYVTVGVKTLTKALASIRHLGLIGRPLPPPPEEAKAVGHKHSKWRDAQAISHHYDVGNDFYRLFLGRTMTYSCARFVKPDDSLDTAQNNKYDLVCRKLGLEPGMRLLDVGCGWGGLAIYAARHYGVHATGITIAREQADLARKRAADEGLQDSVDIRLVDYRDLFDDRFDAISSIGMFEHVGRTQMASYFSILYQSLAPGGRLLNHAIDHPGGSVMPESGFISRYVFPDGELQDLSVSVAAMQDAGFEVRDVESLREHYATTLRHWISNLEQSWEAAVGLVGRNRARVWWIYLVGSAVSFEQNRISVHQTLSVKTFDNGVSAMPPTRHDFV